MRFVNGRYPRNRRNRRRAQGACSAHFSGPPCRIFDFGFFVSASLLLVGFLVCSNVDRLRPSALCLPFPTGNNDRRGRHSGDRIPPSRRQVQCVVCGMVCSRSKRGTVSPQYYPVAGKPAHPYSNRRSPLRRSPSRMRNVRRRLLQAHAGAATAPPAVLRRRRRDFAALRCELVHVSDGLPRRLRQRILAVSRPRGVQEA
jgi:hypothetical protein